jgi:hypothetical protein
MGAWMSSKVTTAYDNFVARVDAVLTSGNGWIKLPHAYNIEKNPEIYLKQGYAIGIGQGANTKRVQSNTISISREFILTIVRTSDTLDLEVTGRQTVEKQLFEDLKLVIADIEGNSTLNSGQILCGYVGDAGIEYVDTENSEFNLIKANFLIEYFETI